MHEISVLGIIFYRILCSRCCHSLLGTEKHLSKIILKGLWNLRLASTDKKPFYISWDVHNSQAKTDRCRCLIQTMQTQREQDWPTYFLAWLVCFQHILDTCPKYLLFLWIFNSQEQVQQIKCIKKGSISLHWLYEEHLNHRAEENTNATYALFPTIPLCLQGNASFPSSILCVRSKLPPGSCEKQ